jgi:hypothetical protein
VRDRAASSKAASDIRSLTSILSHPQCAYALACDTIDGECCLLPATSAANHCAMPLLNGRPILAFLRALVGAFKAEKSFVAQFAGFRGDFSDVTRLIGGKAPPKDTCESARCVAPIPLPIFRHCLGRPRRNAISWRLLASLRGRIARQSRNQPCKSSNPAQEKPERRPPLPNMRRRGIW